jgi:hypothetical protein
MKITIILFILLIILIIFSGNESFEGESECSKIAEGECNSKLCPSNCKIQHSTTSDKCYCTERK